jgi:hypothetical protein
VEAIGTLSELLAPDPTGRSYSPEMQRLWHGEIADEEPSLVVRG